jgi:hypothetical protein
VTGNSPTAEKLEYFLSAIPARFKFWELSLNHSNLFPLEKYPLYERRNFVLDLSPSYETLYAGYRENIKRNIRKSASYGCTLRKDIDVASVIDLAYRFTTSKEINGFAQFEKLYRFLQQKGKAKTYGIFSDRQELIASAVFFYSHNRAYYILVGNHPNGRTLGASHSLIDSFIKDHAGSGLLLDFEGSDLTNLAFFYSSFGAAEEKYAALKVNRLPWYIRLLKR